MSAGTTGSGLSDAIAAGCEQARRLGALLEEEFTALSAQDLPRFESMQAAKEEILAALAQLVQGLTAAGEAGVAPSESMPDTAQWEQFQQLMSDCRDAHRRNDILIRTKLESIRAALRILQNSENSSSVEVYDRMGKMYGYRRGRGYEDA